MFSSAQISVDYLAEFRINLILYSQFISCVIKKSGQLTHKGENRGGPCCQISRYPEFQMFSSSGCRQSHASRNRICCRLDRVGSTHPAFRAAFPQASPTFSNQILFSLRGVFLQSGNPLKSNSSHAVTYSRPKRIMTRIGDFFIKYKLHTDNFSWQRRQGAYRISLKVELFKCSSMALQSKNCFSEYFSSHPIPSVYSIIFHQILSLPISEYSCNPFFTFFTFHTFRKFCIFR